MSEFYRGAWAHTTDKRLATLADPKSIDRIVSFISNTRYVGRSGNQPPLLLPDRMLEELLSNGLRRGLVGFDNLASSLWNASFAEFRGTASNLRGELIAPASSDLRLTPRYIDFSSVTSFEITADLDSFDHKDQGQITKRYSLYRSSPLFDSMRSVTSRRSRSGLQMKQSAASLLEQATAYYPPRDIQSRPLLWLCSHLANREEYLDLLIPTDERFKQVTEGAKARERFRVTHPAQAGLPSLGKNAR